MIFWVLKYWKQLNVFIKYKLNGYVNKFKCPLPPVSVIPKTSMYVCWKNRNVELGKKIEYTANTQLIMSKKNK